MVNMFKRSLQGHLGSFKVIDFKLGTCDHNEGVQGTRSP